MHSRMERNPVICFFLEPNGDYGPEKIEKKDDA